MGSVHLEVRQVSSSFASGINDPKTRKSASDCLPTLSWGAYATFIIKFELDETVARAEVCTSDADLEAHIPRILPDPDSKSTHARELLVVSDRDLHPSQASVRIEGPDVCNAGREPDEHVNPVGADSGRRGTVKKRGLTVENEPKVQGVEESHVQKRRCFNAPSGSSDSPDRKPEHIDGSGELADSQSLARENARIEVCPPELLE